MADGQRGRNDFTIKTKVSFDEETILDSGKKCDLCKEKKSKYTCPRCSLRYCGVDCYKGPKHRQCSEGFYKENVMRELKNMKSTDKNKKRTMEIVKRVMQSEREKNSDVWSDEESMENLAKRMEGVDLDTASFDEMYHRLTEKEKKLFESVVQSGEVEIVDLCKPWWMQGSKNNETSKVNEIEEVEDEKENEDILLDQDAPKLIQSIPCFNTLLPNKKPSEKLPYSVLELITLYCFLYRVYNGELRESLLEVLDCISNLSPVLSENHYYDDLEICLKTLLQRIKGNSLFKDNIDPIKITLNDLNIVVTSVYEVQKCSDAIPMPILCISDLYNLFTNGVKQLKVLKEKTTELKERKVIYHRIAKKLLFMASWLTENNNLIKRTNKSIKAIEKELSTYWNTVEEEKKIIEEKIEQLREKKNTKLIEEM